MSTTKPLWQRLLEGSYDPLASVSAGGFEFDFQRGGDGAFEFGFQRAERERREAAERAREEAAEEEARWRAELEREESAEYDWQRALFEDEHARERQRRDLIERERAAIEAAQSIPFKFQREQELARLRAARDARLEEERAAREQESRERLEGRLEEGRDLTAGDQTLIAKAEAAIADGKGTSADRKLLEMYKDMLELTAGDRRDPKVRQAQRALEASELRAKLAEIFEAGEGPPGLLEKVMAPWSRVHSGLVVALGGEGHVGQATGGWLGLLDAPTLALAPLLDKVPGLDEDKLVPEGARERIERREGFGDFEFLKWRDDDDWWQRWLKVAGAAAGDITIDPITYLTFGTSAVGRQTAGQAAKAVLNRTAADAVKAATPQAKHGLMQRVNPAEIRVWVANATGQSVDEVALLSEKALRQLIDKTPGLADDLALRGLTSGAVQAFHGARVGRFTGEGGSRALYKFLTEGSGLGADVGKQIWKTAPAEVKGGARFRIPFVRETVHQTAERGAIDLGVRLPRAFRLTPGGGQLSGRIPGLDPLLNVAEGSRQFLRSSPSLNWWHTMFARGNSPLYARYVLDAAAESPEHVGRAFSQFDLLTNTFKQSALDSGAVDQATGVLLVGAKRTLAGATDQVEAQKYLSEAFNTRGQWTPDLIDTLKGDKKIGYQTAQRYFDTLDHLIEQAQEIWGPTRWVNKLNDYMPRMYSEAEKARKKAAGSTRLPKRLQAKAEKSRSGVFAEWGIEPPSMEEIAEAIAMGLPRPAGRSFITRWKSATEVADITGRELFETDPQRMLAQYVTRMSKVIAEHRTLSYLERAGGILRGVTRGVDQPYGPRMAATAAEAFAPLQEATGDLAAAVRKLRTTGDASALRQTISKLPGGSAGERVPGTRLRVRRAHAPSPDDTAPWQLADDAGKVIDRRFATQEAAMEAAIARTARDAILEDAKVLGRMLDPEVLPADPAAAAQYMEDIVLTAGRWLDESPQAIRRMISKQKQETTEYGKVVKAEGNVPLSELQVNARVAQHLKGTFGPEGLAKSLQRMFRAYRDPGEVEKWMGDAYKAWYTWWKTTATVGGGPRFWIRNVQGGMFNAWLWDVSPRHYALAGRALLHRQELKKQVRAEMGITRGPRKKDIDFRILVNDEVDRRLPAYLKDKMGDRGAKVARAWEAFRRDDSMRQGLSAHARDLDVPGGNVVRELDIMTTGGRRVPLARGRSQEERGLILRAAEKSIDNPVMNNLMDATEGSETFLRFGAYLKGVEQFGLDDGGRAAGLVVKATQFDYSDLTHFEIGVMKNLQPFFSWSRNNIPLQARALAERPGKITRILHANDALRGQFGVDPERDDNAILPRWVRESFGWEMRNIPTGDNPWAFNLGWWPTADLNQTFLAGRGDMMGLPIRHEEVLSSANPLATAIGQEATGVRFFTRNQFQPTEAAPAWASIPGLRELFFDYRTTADGEATTSPQRTEFARALAPLLSSFDRMVEPSWRQVMPEWMPFGGVRPEDRYIDRYGTSVASMMAGIPVSTLDPRQQVAELRTQQTRITRELRRRFGSRYEEAMEMIRMLEQLGHGPDDIERALKAEGLL